MIPITVGRQKSIKLVKKAYQGNRIIGVVAQKNPQAEEPRSKIFIEQVPLHASSRCLYLPDGNTTIIIQGKNRFAVKEFVQEEPYLTAQIELQPEPAAECQRQGNESVGPVTERCRYENS